MSAIQSLVLKSDNSGFDETLFAAIADDLYHQGYSIKPVALPSALCTSMSQYQLKMDEQRFKAAGIGRGNDYLKNEFVRTDEICWITGKSPEEVEWLNWTAQLQRYLNSRLFLGLFSFESHFAHYAPGMYYKRHYDAFKGEAQRVLSIVTYLNSGWAIDDGGELVLFTDDNDIEGIKVVPLMGTIVVFLSEDFPHEVLPAQRDRYSIAGWYRVNTSVSERVDPPL
ncbi:MULTISPECIES: 2OG-Fe(II) oxygenase [Alteromonadaceae]|uniref:2OG-Fe(II) oxygenase n=1 Tax=Alteromonadaceae TaxID=72275 RepID=UPI001C0A5D5B|nr:MULTISPECIES: 2OG-Fe(II) oxygenase [unclassified Aliiglaciecola]MBU2877418.1 2OG-Fe(II) oxygenase [Aliiglaciecola lipolytica]MDO6712841.1 2OG-Fe(II) oxygenase [Aliiglaciecola sp. 2_MG-2023]MDO6753936.1 2OG-Fe(II) oxygenase [Aliiglaciecola sp. 1_MG-2023]